MKKILFSDRAPKPIGPYSHANQFGDLIFTSGMVALDTEGMIVSEGIKEQTKKTLENLKAVLDDNGSAMENVIKTTVYLKDMNDFASMNEVYDSFFGKTLPARSTVEVARLPKDVKVEIDVIAFKN